MAGSDAAPRSGPGRIILLLAVALVLPVLVFLGTRGGVPTEPRIPPPAEATELTGSESDSSPESASSEARAELDLEATARSEAQLDAPLPPSVVPETETGTGSLLVTARWEDDGTLAPGIGLHLVPRSGGGAVEKGVTSASGRAAFDDLRAGRWTLVTDREAVVEVELRAGEETQVELWLDGSTTLRGRVLGEGGRPVEGAVVVLSDAIERVHAGTYIGRLESRLGSRHRRIRASGRPTAEVTIFFPSDALFWLRSAPAAISDASGEFLLRGALDERFIAVHAQDHLPSAHRRIVCGTVDDLAVEDGVVEFHLPRGGASVRGYVADPDGRPLSGVQVVAGSVLAGTWRRDSSRRWIAPPRPQWTRTDVQGFFEVVGLEIGGSTLFLSASGFAHACKRIELASGEALELNLTLTPGARLTGVVLGKNGRPLAGIPVDVYRPMDPIDWRASTDVEGRFELTGLPGAHLGIWVDAGEDGTLATSVKLDEGEDARMTLRVEEGAILELEFVDVFGSPVADCPVRIRPHQSPRAGRDRLGHRWLPEVLRTDAEGRLRASAPAQRSVVELLHRDYPGTYFLAAQFCGIEPVEGVQRLVAPDETLRPGFIRVEVVLGEGAGSVEVIARQTDGVTPIGWCFTQPFRARAKHEGGGQVSLGPMPAGTYELELEADSGAVLTLTDVALLPGESLDLGRRVVED